MHETITIQLGQCGNQIGNDFWSKIEEEHLNNVETRDRRDKFFYSSERGKMTPRTILIDTEPRAINQNISNYRNTFLTNEGTGASNNWAHGFSLAKTHSEEILELIVRNIEACDNVESIQMIHSCAGGTGSGFSSFLCESLRDMFPKKIFYDFAIMPNNNEASDVVVQPYNTILNLNKIKEYSDAVILMDNFALAKQTDLSLKKIHSYENINSVAADVISSFSSSIRFPNFMYTENKSIVNTLVPERNFNLIVPGIIATRHREYNVSEIVNNLIKQKVMLCNYENSSIYGSTAVWNVLESNLDVNAIARSQRLVQNKINFLGVPYYSTAMTNRRTVNVSYNNSTCIRSVLRKVIDQYEKLQQRNAFLGIYQKFGLEVEEMNGAKENIKGLVEGYETLEMKK